MTTDPMDVPPADHGSDRYDYFEVDAPKGIDPPAALLTRLMETPQCEDCNPNIFLKFIGRVGDDANVMSFWKPTIAHDPTCPTLARIERDGRP